MGVNSKFVNAARTLSMVAKPLLLAVSTVLTVLGVSRILYPLWLTGLIPAAAAAALELNSQIEGLFCITLAALYCTVSRTATTGGLHAIAMSHLTIFIGILYLWPQALAAGFSASCLGWTLAFNAIISLAILSGASAAGSGPAGKAHQYGLTMLLSTAHFAIFATMFFAPSWFAAKVLDASVPSSELNFHIQLSSFLHFAMSAILCTNAKSCSRSFSFGFASGTAITAVWALLKAYSADTPACCKSCYALFGGVSLFIAYYYIVNAPSTVFKAKAVKKD